ncbi:hypothetical protein LSTR_LSTR013903 [Laodelphax striatellus]|uniref:Small nuclear ribonucleoprotein G n=1 Tax=Laodelphax striatellus TaxID=195883 RepID=A0A482X580_LAOST|nr:hypothetical protein LSTR_LSTR013903 [Laodelphax striatellus]
MSKAHAPELKKLMEKTFTLKLNGGRVVTGVLRGYDPFMNVTIADAVETRKDGSKEELGIYVIRGNSIIMMEALDRI